MGGGEEGEEERPVDGGFRSRHGNANDGLTKRSPTLVSRSLNRPVHPLCVIGTSVAPDRPRGGGIQRAGSPVLARQRSKSFFRGFVSNQLYAWPPNYRASFSPDFVEPITEYYIPTIEKDSGGKGIRRILERE